MSTCVIYARYSSDRQRAESIDDQLRVCREYCGREGMTEVAVYTDSAMTGRTDARPGFRTMIDDIERKGGIDYVVVYKLDRFSRDKYDAAVYKKRLRDAGARVVSATETVPDSPEGIIMESMLEGMAAYYSRNLAQNVKRGMEGNALECRYNGEQYFGYDVDESRHYVINEKEAEAVRDVYEMYVSGMGSKGIAAELRARGVRKKDGKPLTHNHIERMVRNERYVGIYIWGDVRVEGGMPAIITRAQFEAARHRKMRRTSKRGDFYLSGLITCARCGKKLVSGCGTSGNGERHDYYRCACEYIPKASFEGFVNDAVKTALESADIERIARIAYEEATEGDAEREEAMRSRLRTLDSQIDKLLDVLAKVPSEAVTERLVALEEERKSLKADLGDMSRSRIDFSVEDMVEFVRSAAFQEDSKAMAQAFVAEGVKDGDSLVLTMNYRDSGLEQSAVFYYDANGGLPQLCIERGRVTIHATLPPRAKR